MPPDFNPSYVTPGWAWWIVLYFFVGGVTGGVYFAAAWLDLFGDQNDRPAAGPICPRFGRGPQSVILEASLS